MPFIIVLFALMALALVLVLRYVKKRARKTALLVTALSDHQRKIIAEQVPMVLKLPVTLHNALEGKINLFLDQVDIVGCNGLEVTEEMELAIAAQACLLVVNSDTWYDHLTTVLVYPGAFKSRTQRHNGYVVTEEEVVRTGESWSRGPVILSWAHSQSGAADSADGHNVVLHEFAHQLDDLSGTTNGAPVLNKGQSHAVWGQVFTDAHARHMDAVAQGRRTAMDGYGATNHAEFFAVAIETFFERPDALRAEEPEVYAELTKLLQLDPASWRRHGGNS